MDCCNLCAEAEAERAQAVPSGVDAGAAVSLQFGVRRLRQDPVPSAYSEDRPDARRLLPRSGRVRDADGLDSRRRTAAASADAGDRGWAGGAQEVRLHVYQCAAIEGEAAFIYAEQVPFVLGACGRAARAPRPLRVPRGWIRHCDGGRAGRGCCGFPRDHEYNAVRWGRSQQRARALRRVDGGGRGEHDGVAGLYLRKSAGPEPFSGEGEVEKIVPRNFVESKEELGVQYAPIVFRVFN